MANLEKEAKAAGLLEGSTQWCSGSRDTGYRETEGHLTHSMNNRDTTMASTGPKVLGLPGISGP